MGASGSGKSALGLELARRYQCEIFSLDSLSIYQSFNIVSAKPSPSELACIHHYGINILTPNENNNAMLFKKLLLEAIESTQKKGKEKLLIIGGSSFYLKSILDGLSPQPTLSPQQAQEIAQKIHSIPNPYDFLHQIDPHYPIHPNDTYRLRKALEIYFATSLPPSIYFAEHPKEPFPYPIETYCIALDREVLRQRITKRTQMMIQNGLLEEIEGIYRLYHYGIQASSAIGVRESIEYLTQTPLEILQNKPFSSKSPIIAKNTQELCNLISTHTAQLAKRQTTFNRTQFGQIYSPHSPNSQILSQQGIIHATPQELFKLLT